MWGEKGGRGERLVRNRKELLATPIPLSPRLLIRCVSGGGSIKSSAFSSAVQKYCDAYKLFEKNLRKRKKRKMEINLRILHIHCMRKIAHVWNIAIV